MSDIVFYILCGILSVAVLIGIAMMSKVKTAVTGNRISAIAMVCAIALVLVKYEIISVLSLWICMALGLAIGILWAYKVKMIEMPQMVALLNGFGGIASAIVGTILMVDSSGMNSFELITAALALVVGIATFTGSMVAAGKLHKVISQKPIILKYHQLITVVLLILSVLSVVLAILLPDALFVSIAAGWIAGGLFGIVFTVRVGGADMPITISLLNSLSGVAGSIAGMAANNYLTVAVGGIVGASGLLLTQIMCRSMNRRLGDILLGKTTVASSGGATKKDSAEESADEKPEESLDLAGIIKAAKRVIIVPGYGMALAQAQHLVSRLSEALEKKGATVDFAIHPVAGRMPGHMNVLLAEANVPYEKLKEMDDINPEFANCDLAIVVGANDVINPAANTAEGTPIYGMPVLNVEQAKHIVICNYDLNPGYAGVENALYKKKNVIMKLGDAKETVSMLIDLI
ncbi:MAG: NAD(P)(+) transhydrogenase (Re/Si-specific) subunit beta [Clostridia bacterium]|jgi:NAD(P) transhydrogenase subunit beta